MKTVTVIGGGITGLSTLYYLQKLNREYDLHLNLVLIEKENDLGGKIKTIHKDHYIMETGADSMVARNAHLMPFIKELGLEEEMVYNTTGTSYIYTDGRLHEIPAESVFGIPASMSSLFNSTLISHEGKIRAMKDFTTPNTKFSKEDSVAVFLKAFLGEELVEKQISPVLSGVYSGKLDKLTLASTLPYLVDYKNEYGSILKGMFKNKSRFLSGNKKFISFENGLSRIIERLEEELSGACIHKGTSIKQLTREGERYKISFEKGSDFYSDFVVISTPHQAAKTIVGDQELNQEFDRLVNSSLISVYLGFEFDDAELPANGTGFIVSENSGLDCDACTWTSRKWSHTSKKQKLLIRLFYKSSNQAWGRLKDASREELIETALSDIEKSLGIQEQPSSAEVTSWKELMPNYTLQHSGAVSSLNQKLESLYPGLFLAGASYYGVGIAACIKNGEETAEKISGLILSQKTSK
ncbi:protoporphyrinogen oxidase [Peribacillus kribbensis]|uniref:protoporphyrinogen oxidase n=1 Tax=Peribacillus kribbensis TaxID=356658 RepID=UPI000414BA44|nr:protoporphyrinogen oxidase [Peribacillus kribbensis]